MIKFRLEETHSVLDLIALLFLLPSTGLAPLISPQVFPWCKFHVAITPSPYIRPLSLWLVPLKPTPTPPAALTIRAMVPPPLPLEADTQVNRSWNGTLPVRCRYSNGGPGGGEHRFFHQYQSKEAVSLLG